MKQFPAFTALAAMLFLLAAGCASQETRSTRAFGTVEAAKGDAPKGYVEFIAVSDDTVIPVYQLDENGRPYLLAAVGLDEGDWYSHRRHRTDVVETLRVSQPAGTHEFMIERNGRTVRVPVAAGRITPVEIEYALLDEAPTGKVFRMDVRVFDPVPFQETKLETLR